MIGGLYLGEYYTAGPSSYDALSLNTKLFVDIGGAETILEGSLAVSTSTSRGSASFQVPSSGTRPVPYSPVRFGLGSFAPDDLLFRGKQQVTVQTRKETVDNQWWEGSAVDSSMEFNRYLAWGTYTSIPGDVIALDLLSKFAPDFTGSGIQLGLPNVTMILEGGVMDSAFQALAKSVGGYYYRDNAYGVHLYITETVLYTPDTIDMSVLSLLMNPPLQSKADVSMTRNRVVGVGGNTTLLAAVNAGETILPVKDATIFDASPNTAMLGAQRITYTNRQVSGAGTLVGPAVGPAAAPAAALLSGTGIDPGTHSYAYTYQTPTGESIPSPLATVVTGLTAAPGAVLAAGTRTIGSGPDPGSHDYAVTFVSPSGETTPSTPQTFATGLTPGIVTAPSALAVQTGIAGHVDPGLHDYVFTEVTSVGETLPGLASSAIEVISLSDPTTAPVSVVTNTGVISGGGGSIPPPGTVIEIGYYYFDGTAGHGNASSAITSTTTSYTTVANGAFPGIAGINVTLAGVADSHVTIIWVTYRYLGVWWNTGSGVSNPGFGVNATANNVAITNNSLAPGHLDSNIVNMTLPLGDSNTTSRKLYRRFNGSGTYKLAATIANNTTTSFQDTVANASLGAAAPSVNTAYLQRCPLSNIPTGPAPVTSRRLWRTVAGGSQLKLLAVLGDNSTTVFTDTVTDGGLGANAPVVNTATAQQVSLTGIATGGTPTNGRRLWRTAANLSQLKLLTTFANNTVTTFTDSTPDASLGINAPTSDTSGLPQPVGQVLAGASQILMAGSGPFSSTGGWVIIGNGQQVVRYTGFTGNTLTGVPTSGVGSIAATVSYGSTATSTHALTGIPPSGAGSISYSPPLNALVRLYAVQNDLVSQALVASIEGGTSTGVYEFKIDDSTQLTQTALNARCSADLAQYAAGTGVLTISYTTYDRKSVVGRPVTINRPLDGVVGTFVIQSVSISQIGVARQFPLYACTASSVRFSFEDYLRRALVLNQ